MKYTPNLRLPYPEPADPPRGAEQIQGLATAVDSILAPSWCRADGPEITTGGADWNRLPTPNLTDLGGWIADADGAFAVPADGMYLVGAAVTFDAPLPGGWQANIAQNATTSPDRTVLALTSKGTMAVGSIPAIFERGDKISVWIGTGHAVVRVLYTNLFAIRIGPKPGASTPPGAFTPPGRTY